MGRASDQRGARQRARGFASARATVLDAYTPIEEARGALGITVRDLESGADVGRGTLNRIKNGRCVAEAAYDKIFAYLESRCSSG